MGEVVAFANGTAVGAKEVGRVVFVLESNGGNAHGVGFGLVAFFAEAHRQAVLEFFLGGRVGKEGGSHFVANFIVRFEKCGP